MSTTHANRLARICAYSAQAPQWDDFVRAVTPVLALAARRVGTVWGDTSRHTINEIIQEVFLKLCEDERRILREFEDRGNDSFLKLLRVVTASIATDYFRRIRAEKRGGQMNMVSLDADMLVENKTSTVDSSTVELPTLIAQLDRLILRNAAKISPRDRALFWLYYRHGLTSEAISRIPAIGLSAKGVESALSRISRTLRHAIVSAKPLPKSPMQFPEGVTDGKGFPRVVAIDSIKNRY